MAHNKNDLQATITSTLQSGNFNHSGAGRDKLADPLVDTPMVVTLDELKPYELNPRVTRNPLYDDIKASISERGLDAPPAITRRPGADHYIIRNGGNTRLSILNELWSETRDEKYFRIHCVFRPWTNEIVALTGHLAEGELHGDLTFIEKALAVCKAQELYEKDTGRALTQRRLAELLTSHGYPISQSQISRMQDCVHYLLPVMPIALYDGLSKTQVGKLLGLRNAAQAAWEKHAPASEAGSAAIDVGLMESEFTDLFLDTLARFDNKADQFDYSKLQDEITAQMAARFACSYDQMALDLLDKGALQKSSNASTSTATQPVIDEAALFAKPSGSLDLLDESQIIELQMPNNSRLVVEPESTKPIATQSSISPTAAQPPVSPKSSSKKKSTNSSPSIQESSDKSQELEPPASNQTPESATEQNTLPFLQAHIVSPIDASGKSGSLQNMVTELTGESRPQDFVSNVIQAIPVQAGGLYPISDVWYIAPSLDDEERLRVHIAQLVLEIAEESGCGDLVDTCESGLGFLCHSAEDSATPAAKWLSLLLTALRENAASIPADSFFLSLLSACLLGAPYSPIERLSDVALVKTFRVIRLARRYFELIVGAEKTIMQSETE